MRSAALSGDRAIVRPMTARSRLPGKLALAFRRPHSRWAHGHPRWGIVAGCRNHGFPGDLRYHAWRNRDRPRLGDEHFLRQILCRRDQGLDQRHVADGVRRHGRNVRIGQDRGQAHPALVLRTGDGRERLRHPCPDGHAVRQGDRPRRRAEPLPGAGPHPGDREPQDRRGRPVRAPSSCQPTVPELPLAVSPATGGSRCSTGGRASTSN